MSVVYGNLAAKKALANAMSAAGKIKYDYDSDEDTEGGKWKRVFYRPKKVYFTNCHPKRGST